MLVSCVISKNTTLGYISNINFSCVVIHTISKSILESIDNFCSLLSAVNTLYLHEDTMDTIKNSVIPSLGQEVYNQMLIITTERSRKILHSDEDDYIKPSDMIDGE